jgi:hypothetical protein
VADPLEYSLEIERPAPDEHKNRQVEKVVVR